MRPLNVRVPAAVLALALALGATDARRAPRTLLQDDPAASEASPEVLGTLGTLDPRWSSHAAQLARSCGGNETEAPGDAPSSVPSSTEYVPCLAREVDDAVAALNDVPGAMCTLVSLVADNHLGVRRCLTAGTHPRRVRLVVSTTVSRTSARFAMERRGTTRALDPRRERTTVLLPFSLLPFASPPPLFPFHA